LEILQASASRGHLLSKGINRQYSRATLIVDIREFFRPIP
jgi:hypothetical protein